MTVLITFVVPWYSDSASSSFGLKHGVIVRLNSTDVAYGLLHLVMSVMPLTG